MATNGLEQSLHVPFSTCRAKRQTSPAAAFGLGHFQANNARIARDRRKVRRKPPNRPRTESLGSLNERLQISWPTMLSSTSNSVRTARNPYRCYLIPPSYVVRHSGVRAVQLRQQQYPVQFAVLYMRRRPHQRQCHYVGIRSSQYFGSVRREVFVPLAVSKASSSGIVFIWVQLLHNRP